MSQFVPASTSIKRNRVGNIDSDRLQRRQQFLADMARGGFRDIGRRCDFVVRAAELQAIEDELARRGQAFDRMSLPRAVTHPAAAASSSL